MNHDNFHSTAAPMTLQDAFLLLDSVQQLPTHRRVLSVVLLFRMLQQQLGLDVSQLIDMADRISHDADSRYFDHIHAIRTYIDREIKDRT